MLRIIESAGNSFSAASRRDEQDALAWRFSSNRWRCRPLYIRRQETNLFPHAERRWKRLTLASIHRRKGTCAQSHSQKWLNAGQKLPRFDPKSLTQPFYSSDLAKTWRPSQARRGESPKGHMISQSEDFFLPATMPPVSTWCQPSSRYGNAAWKRKDTQHY